MAKNEVPNDPLSKFSLSVFSINGWLLRSGEYVTRPLGQSSARWQVLGRAGYKPQTVSQMARSIGNSRQSVQRIADALASEGLIDFKSNPADKRAPLVELTNKGSDILTAIYARDQEWSRDLMAKLDPDQLVALAEALDTIRDAIKLTIADQPKLEENDSEDN